MELEYNLLERVLSNESLNNLIETTTCPKTLNCLLQIKQRRLTEGHCERINVSISCIYNENIKNVGLAIQILKTTLSVAANSEHYLMQAIKYCLEKLQSSKNTDELYYALNLLNVVLEYCNQEYKQINCLQCNSNQFHNGILTVLRGPSKPLITFTLTHLLPNYLNVNDDKVRNILLIEIFTLIKETKKLEILCVLYDKFITADFNPSNFNLLKFDDYWLLLMDCIVSQHSYQRKQAVYLLSRSVEVAFKANNSNCFPKYLKAENDVDDIEKMWRNYLILLDVSNEKQLHIIEPSLQMLSSIKKLHILWRVQLYKIFLNCSQNVVVYKTAMFILQNESDWSDSRYIISDVLFSINKNECNVDSKRIFREIGNFCNKLNEQQFQILLRESLNILWIPAAIWCFCNSVFNTATNFSIPLSLMENITKKLKLIPHKFIREGCLDIVLIYFAKSPVVLDSLNDLLKILDLLWQFKPTSLDNFLESNRETVLPYVHDLRRNLLSPVVDDYNNFQLAMKIFGILQIELLPVPKITTYSIKTDLIHLFFRQHFNGTDVENYVLNRIDSLDENDDVTVLLRLNKDISVPALSEKAFHILLDENTARYSNTQKVVAFGIISTTGKYSARVIDFWKKRFLRNTQKIDERITHFFVEIIFNSLGECCTDTEIEETVIVLGNVLDSQSSATITILENISQFLKYIDQTAVLQFFDRCFEEFLNFIKNGDFKATANLFLTQIFHPSVLANDKFSARIVDFTERLLNTSNNTIAYILSEKIAKLCKEIPQKAFIFIPVIVELILYGIKINKNDKVEYSACQEIAQKLGKKEHNPNLEEISVRLWAFDAMLQLIKEQPPKTENVIKTFVSILIEKYMKHFAKRYFPDSQIHLHKLRIMQALLLIHTHVKSEESKLVEVLVESFLMESHQPSVKHLMQWLLICLLKQKNEFFIQHIGDKFQIADRRVATISSFIPILYHLVTPRDEQSDQVVNLLLPHTMGPQFKLRIYSQVAILKLYEKALQNDDSHFVNKYKILYDSLKQVVDATDGTVYDFPTMKREFLDYFSVENCDHSTIFYAIPKENGVTAMEWENLTDAASHKQFNNLRFNHTTSLDDDATELPGFKSDVQATYNIQKKITPWKDMLDNPEAAKSTNDFILVTSLIEKSANLGGLSRTCEVFGIKQIVMRTSKVAVDKEFKSLSMSSENWVDILEVKVEDLSKFIVEMKTQGYSVIGAEQTAESVKLDDFHFPKMTVLVLGNEKEGIPPNLIPLLDHCIEIPQFGMTRSLNVHVAGAIVIWEYCKQQRL